MYCETNQKVKIHFVKNWYCIVWFTSWIGCFISYELMITSHRKSTWRDHLPSFTFLLFDWLTLHEGKLLFFFSSPLQSWYTVVSWSSSEITADQMKKMKIINEKNEMRWFMFWFWLSFLSSATARYTHAPFFENCKKTQIEKKFKFNDYTHRLPSQTKMYSDQIWMKYENKTNRYTYKKYSYFSLCFLHSWNLLWPKLL